MWDTQDTCLGVLQLLPIPNVCPNGERWIVPNGNNAVL